MWARATIPVLAIRESKASQSPYLQSIIGAASRVCCVTEAECRSGGVGRKRIKPTGRPGKRRGLHFQESERDWTFRKTKRTVDFQESEKDWTFRKRNGQWTFRKTKRTVDCQENETDSGLSGKQKRQWTFRKAKWTVDF